MSEIPDCAPAVSVSIEYGKYVNEFDVDIAGMTYYLQERGVADEDIANMHIGFLDTDHDESEIVSYGHYNRKEDKIGITHLSDIQEASKIGHYIATDVRNDMLNETVVHELEHKIAFHDKATEKESKRYDNKIFRKRLAKPYLYSTTTGMSVAFGPQVFEAIQHLDSYHVHPLRGLGGIAIMAVMFGVMGKRSMMRKRTHDEYLAEPEEKRAREAVTKYPRQFCRFEPKCVEEITPERIEYEEKILVPARKKALQSRTMKLML